MMIPMGLAAMSYKRIQHFKKFVFESEKAMGHELNATELMKMKAFVSKHLA